jgi:hypothetical protein
MQRPLIPVYTRNPGLIEAEFLKREFNLILTEISESNLSVIKNLDICIFATTDPPELEIIIKDAKPFSVIIFLLGNETYSIPTFEYLNKYKEKIKMAFIYNLPKKTSYWISFRCLLATVYDGGLFYKGTDGNILRNFKNGIDFMRRNRKLNILYPHFDFPLGYTNMFIHELSTLGLISNDNSLFNIEFLSKFIDCKIQTMTFVGANGSWTRRLAIEKMNILVSDSDYRFVQNSYQSLNTNSKLKTDYIESLMKSKFILCPPGNLTNKTFRYLESLLMGALPILPPATIQDNHLWNTWSESSEKVNFSWTNCIKQALGMRESSRKKQVTRALEIEFQRIIDINKKIDLAVL